MATQSSKPGFWYFNPAPGMSKYLFSHLGLEAPSFVMPCSDAVKRLKRFRVFDSSLGVLGFLFAAVCVLCFFFYLNHGVVHKGFRFFDQTVQFAWLKTNGSVPRPKVNFLEREGDGCDVFDGDWVWDEAYPLYQSRDCGFMDDGFRCSENGRPDLFYTKWRWQPKDCNLPRFNAKLMLEKLRNKRIVFVGDSIGRNQWESLLCMLSSSVLNKDSIYEVNGSPITKHKGSLLFKFREYNCTVEYYRAPFLVLQSRPPARAPRKIKTTLKVDKMDWNSDKWRDADLLLLNSGHWWNYEKTLRGGCYFQEGEEVKMEMRVVNAYKRSMETVVNWIHREVNISRTQVFFRTYAPVHFRGGNWKNGGHCHFEILPEEGSSLVPQEIWAGFHIITDVLSATRMDTSGAAEVTVLNITAMSARRKDGHSSLYYLRPNKGPVSRHRQDCSHWCLPGVPDAWNELLYALFLKREAATHIRNSQSPSLWQ